MAILPIRMYPDPVLREPASAVTEVDDSVHKLVRDMSETMRAAPGVGLAAPQIGVQRRVLVYDVAEEEEDLHVLINPEIVERFGEVIADEGCLSIPGLAFPLARAQKVTVRALGADGAQVEYEAEDLEARVIQHEVDHLDGVLFIDRLPPDERREAMRAIREQAVNGAPTPAPRTPAARI
jgi:peptide deformylase